MATKDNNDFQVTDEILSSDRIGSYTAYAFGLPPGAALPDSPSWLWEQLRFNPWMAQAIYDDIEEKDDMVASCLDARKENVLSKSRHVRPASDKRRDGKIAEFIEDTLEGYINPGTGERFGLDNVLWEALDFIGRGVAIGENIFGEANDRIYIQDVKFKPPHLFTFGEGMLAPYSTGIYPYPQTGPLRLRPGMMIENWEFERPLPEKKFFVHSFRPRYGNRWGSPLLRKVFWLSWFKRANVKNWLRYGEKGAGTVASRYNDGAGAAEQQNALDAARAIFEESVVALPKKFQIEVLESVRTSMGSSFKEFADEFCNNGIARVIRGQTLTSRGSEGGGGSRALGQVHQQVEAVKTEVDAKNLMMAVNTKLVWPLTLLNFGPVERPPVWVINYEQGANLEKLSAMLLRLWQMRLPIPRSFVYNTFQIAEPDEGEEVLPPPPSDAALPPPDDAGEVDKEAGGFAEKKSRPGASSSRKQPTQPGLNRARFERLRPSTTPRSAR
jgi:phage gp29-like protein